MSREPTGGPQTGVTEAAEAAAAAVDLDALVETARALVRIRSDEGRETPAQEAMAEAMRAAGLDVDSWSIDLDRVTAHPACATEIERTDPVGVVGTLAGRGGGRSLILNGHVDVVPSGDPAAWTYPPYEGVVADGRLYGRGALDLKGPLVAALYAVRAVREAGVRLAGPVHVQSVVGEEDGGMGTLAAILRGYRADGAVVVEPTGLAVAPAQAGCLNFRIRVVGRAAHGAVREEGVSALDRLVPVLDALRRLEAERNARLGGGPLFSRYATPFAISVGTVHGGDWASSVPDHVTVEGRMGLAPSEAPEDARSEMQAALADVAVVDAWFADHPAELTWWGGRFLAAEIPTDHPLVTTLQNAAKTTLGRPVPLEGMTYGADMGLLAGVGGTPTVLFGAGDIRRAHRPDEWVGLDELEAMARTLARAIVRFCGVADAD